MTEYGKTLVEAAYKAHRNFRGNGGLDDVLGPKLTDKTRAALLAFLDKLIEDYKSYGTAISKIMAAEMRRVRSEIAEESGR